MDAHPEGTLGCYDGFVVVESVAVDVGTGANGFEVGYEELRGPGAGLIVEVTKDWIDLESPASAVPSCEVGEVGFIAGSGGVGADVWSRMT